MLGGIGGRRRRGQQRMRWLDGIQTRWTWVWVNSRSWWWTGRPGVLRFMGSQRVGHIWATDLIWIITYPLQYSWISLVAQTVKNPPAMRETWVWKMPWRRAWQPIQYSCLENPYEQRSLAGYSPWGPKESDMTERLSTAQHRLLMTIPRLNVLDANTTEMILRPS